MDWKSTYEVYELCSNCWKDFPVAWVEEGKSVKEGTGETATFFCSHLCHTSFYEELER